MSNDFENDELNFDDALDFDTDDIRGSFDMYAEGIAVPAKMVDGDDRDDEPAGPGVSIQQMAALKNW